MGNVIFNGVSSLDLGVVVQTPPAYELPEKDYKQNHIAGRSGDIIISNHAYKNVERSYEFACVIKRGSNFIACSRAISDWLHSSSGYCRLEDSYDPDVYRMAFFSDELSFTNYLDQAFTFTALFNCKPQRYLKSGEDYNVITERYLPKTITNPTLYISEPEIVVESQNPLNNIIINFESYGYSGDDRNTIITLNSESTSMIIDSELQDCYNSQKFLNSDVSFTNGFPKLYPGKTLVTVISSSGVTVKIKPRWWTL